MGITGLLFSVGFLTGCVLALVRHPIFGLMTYVAVFYLHPPSRWWGAALPDVRWSLIAAAVTLVAVLIRRGRVQAVPLLHHKVMIGFIVFLLWLAIQTLWALDRTTHQELLILMAKYALLLGVIYKCVDSERHLKFFLWTHVLGCFYLGWVAFESYLGGRQEGFGGPGIEDANSAALQVVTGILAGSSLFLVGRVREKAVLLGCMPFIVNALVTTISRSGFLALVSGGLVFNFFAPARVRGRVRIFSVLAVVLLFMLTNPVYWSRIDTLRYAGTEVEGVDTGAGRMVIIRAQWRMFLEHPLGCGHRCTAALSPQFLPDSYLTGPAENRGRSSHNTMMTMLVEHGIPGAALYVLLLLWLVSGVRAVARQHRNRDDLLATLVPSVASILAAIVIGEVFVDYLKLEVRVWFIAVLMIMLDMGARLRKEQAAPATGAGS